MQLYAWMIDWFQCCNMIGQTIDTLTYALEYLWSDLHKYSINCHNTKFGHYVYVHVLNDEN